MTSIQERGRLAQTQRPVAYLAVTSVPLLRRVNASEGISSGELPDSADPDVLASMLIGSFYARYIATSDIPDDWAEQTLRHAWPDARSAQPRVQAHPG